MNPAVRLPARLKEGQVFVNWKLESVKGGKDAKIPYDGKTGRPARTNDPSTWADFDTCHKAYRRGKYTGLGIVLTSDDDLICIDLDSCLDEKGKPTTEAATIVSKFSTYIEISPSERGLHIWLRGRKPGSACKKGKIEIYETGRYITLTGKPLFKDSTVHREVNSQQKALDELYYSLWPKKEAETPVPETKGSPRHSLTDEEIITKAKVAKNGEKFSLLWDGNWEEAGYESQSDGDQALTNMLTFWCGPDPDRIDRLFRKSKLHRKKWDTKHRGDGATYGEMTIEKALEEVTDFYTEKGLADEKYRVLPGDSKEEKEPPPVELEFSKIMDGVAGQFAEVYSTYLEAPPHFFYMAFLTALGATLADRIKLVSAIEPQPRLYTILLGESATVRKSTAIQQTVKLFKEIPGDYLHTCWGIGSPEGLQKRLKENNRLLVCFDEFKQFVSKCQITASVMLPCVNTLFESNQYENSTKKSDIRLDDVYLSMLAASTTATYQNTWSSQFTDIGFTNRLFLVPGTAKKKFSVPYQIPRGEKTSLIIRLTKIFKRAEVNIWFKITPDARRLFHKWYMKIEDSVHSARLDTYAMRLMSLLAVNEDKKEVDVEITKKVITLCNWQLKVRKLYDPVDADNTIAKLEEGIRRRLKLKPHTMRDLKKFTNADRYGVWFFDRAIKNLHGIGEIRWDMSKKRWTV